MTGRKNPNYQTTNLPAYQAKRLPCEATTNLPTKKVIYRSTKVIIDQAGVWREEEMYLDKKIHTILGVEANVSKFSLSSHIYSPQLTFGTLFHVSIGNDMVIEDFPIHLIYGNQDIANGVQSKMIFDFNGSEGLANKEGFVKVGAAFMGDDYLVYGPVNQVRNPQKPIHPQNNPIVFKYPFEVQFRFKCLI